MAGCAKCGSKVLIDQARIIDHGDTSEQDLAVTVYRHPLALFFKGGVSRPLHAKVCCSCGYTELYVQNPLGLVQAVQEADESTRGLPQNPAAPWYWQCATCRRMNAPSSKECMDCSAPR